MAYWISFGLAFINNGYSAVRWRFLLAFQCFPALILACCIRMLPDSPRYLASVGRKEEARELLELLRKHKATPDEIDREYLEIVTLAKESQRSSPVQFAKILLGKGSKIHANLGRRAWLCVWLQIMASWTGITVRIAQDFSQTGSNFGPNLGCHRIFSGSSASGRVQHDQAKRPGRRPQYSWYRRNNY